MTLVGEEPPKSLASSGDAAATTVQAGWSSPALPQVQERLLPRHGASMDHSDKSTT